MNVPNRKGSECVDLNGSSHFRQKAQRKGTQDSPHTDLKKTHRRSYRKIRLFKMRIISRQLLVLLGKPECRKIVEQCLEFSGKSSETVYCACVCMCIYVERARLSFIQSDLGRQSLICKSPGGKIKNRKSTVNKY